MSDLTEFLLARVAEDEAVARAWAGAYNNPGSHPEYHYATMRRHRREWPVLWRSLDAYPPARVLAECEAKRRIVSTMQSAIDGGWQSQSREEIEFVATRTLRALALPYADHPDYDEAWRP